MPRKKPSRRTVQFAENRSVLQALTALVRWFERDRPRQLGNPLYVHGPAGSGKTHIVQALSRQIAELGKGLSVNIQSANELRPETAGFGVPQPAAWGDCDLFIVEDLQHLSASGVEGLIQAIDYRTARRLPCVFTATLGPGQLGRSGGRFPARLTSRLAGGLVTSLEPWRPPSRLAFLEELAQSRQLAVAPSILRWLAENLPGSGRVLEGALDQVEALSRQNPRPLELPAVVELFQTMKMAHEPTIERITQQVSGYFRLEPSLLQSPCRHRSVLLPRQVSMYLTRQLTALSLEQIGTYFGGRDHATVLHSCRKMERALKVDPNLSGAVRQLHAQLM